VPAVAMLNKNIYIFTFSFESQWSWNAGEYVEGKPWSAVAQWS